MKEFYTCGRVFHPFCAICGEAKIFLKKAKKVVDIPKKGWYISQALERDAHMNLKSQTKFLKIQKFLLTNRFRCGNINKLPPRGGELRECTLKIEQCKKKLMQISTREGFF